MTDLLRDLKYMNRTCYGLVGASWIVRPSKDMAGTAMCKSDGSASGWQKKVQQKHPLHKAIQPFPSILDSKKLEYGFRVIYAGVPSFTGFEVEDSRIPTFWLLL